MILVHVNGKLPDSIYFLCSLQIILFLLQITVLPPMIKEVSYIIYYVEHVFLLAMQLNCLAGLNSLRSDLPDSHACKQEMSAVAGVCTSIFKEGMEYQGQTKSLGGLHMTCFSNLL